MYIKALHINVNFLSDSDNDKTADPFYLKVGCFFLIAFQYFIAIVATML